MYQLPACIPYIESSHLSADYLYNILYSARKKRYPEEEMEETQLKETLIQTGWITKDCIISKQVTQVNCFQVSSENQCSFICKICPYFPTFKNEKENEEKLILSYMLKSYIHTQNIIHSGFHEKELLSLYLLEDNKPILFPLNSTIFQYLLCKVSKNTDYNEIPSLFTHDFKMQNRNKIKSETCFDKIKLYIEKLQVEQVQLERINPTLQTFSVTYKIQEERWMELEHNEVIPPAPYKTESNPPVIQGLLQATPISQMKKIENKTVRTSCSTVPKKENQKKENVITPKPEIKVDVAPNENKGELGEMAPLYLDISKNGSVKIKKEEDWYYHMDLQQELLLHPVIALELLIDIQTNKDIFILYMDNTFYTISADNESFLEWITCFVSMSGYRTIISYDAYRLYHFFINNKINTKHIFSLSNAYLLFSEISKTPALVLNEMISEDITVSTFYLTFMPYYEKAWKTYTKKIIKENRWKDLEHKNNILSILSYSYERKDYSIFNDFLFVRLEKGDYEFKEKKDYTKKFEGAAVQFQFTYSNDGQIDFVYHVLGVIGKEKIYIDSFYLIEFHENNFTILLKRLHDYEQVCERINYISTYLAQDLECSPITVYIQRNWTK